MWTSDYKLSNVDIAPGLEIIVEGRAEIYKPSGRLSLRAQSIELVGEGALKKAYDALKKKLELEGLFRESRKRPLPKFPTRIGVITSKQGAVIHDFLNNLGKFGFEVRFIDARVEGVLAVKDIYRAIARMKTEDIDVLVLIRGGGSLESLQAFNNEYVVRALAEFPKPVLCAIGHDKDVPLAQLVADHAPSTPTACTALLNESWVSASSELAVLQKTIIGAYERTLQRSELDVLRAQRYFERMFTTIESSISDAIDGVLRIIPQFSAILKRQQTEVLEQGKRSGRILRRALEQIGAQLLRYDALLEAHDPMRQLRLGYSILRSEGGVLRSVHDVEEGATIDAQLWDGTLSAKITKIDQYDKKITK
jgi:exodeoxyribonuclease VII large subunit